MERVDLIIKADYILTMEDGLPVIDNGAIAISNGRIRDVGDESSVLTRYESQRMIGGGKRVAFPGLINTHTHAAMVYFRGIADDLPLQEWLERHIWPNEMRWLTAGFVDDAIELACLEMLKAGVTTYADMYFYQSVAAKRLQEIGMRAVLGTGIIDFPWGDYARTPDDYFRKAEENIKEWKGHELITPCVAPHATFTCGPENYKRAKEMADRYDVPLHTHLSETGFEVSECVKRYGKRPVEYLDDLGILSERLFAAHCVWVDEREIELLARRNVGVSHCIESNLKLASGVSPIPQMLKAGIRVGLGTDGAASNNDLNILGEMATVAKVHKAYSNDPTAIDSKTALLMATRYGAEILGLGREIGTITPGKKADIVIANLNHPHLTPLYDIYSHITYAMRPSDVESVIVNGRVVVEDGKALTIDEEVVMEKARGWQERIKAEE
ncbi:MAG: amidohydrolase family protein [Thermodesulfovibrionia bacterium]